MESAVRQFVQTRGEARIAQQTFGGHDHQRLAPATQHLPAEKMEILRRGGWINHLDVLLRREREKAFETRTGMFGAAPFKTVRQQEDQARQPTPLVFRADNELIDNDLRGVDEVAILRLPENQAFGRIQAVTIIETKNTSFGQRAVEDIDRRLVRREMLQWHVRMTILVIIKDGMPLAEGASRAVLTAQPDRTSFRGKAGEGQGFRRGPIQWLISPGHRAPGLDEFSQLRMQMKICWQLRLLFEQRG